jgi:hexosaminidase
METKKVLIITLSTLLLVALVVIIVIALRLGKQDHLQDEYNALSQQHNLITSGNPEPEKSAVQQTLWPMPASYTSGTATVRLSNQVSFQYPSSQLLDAAVDRFKNNVFGTSGLPNNNSGCVSVITIQVKNMNVDLQLFDDTSMEGYTLSVDPTAGIVLSANTVYGAIHGLTTLRQLIAISVFDSSLSDTRFTIPNSPWLITDTPRFAYRGILIDCTRHYLPLVIIKNIIAGMALSKFNTLHWHVIDAQSFPLYLPSIPELSDKGSYKQNGKNLIYSLDDVQDIIQFAKEHAIRVVCEVEMPGHASSWRFAYPDIVNCTVAQDQNNNMFQYALEPPAGQLNPTNPLTYQVIGKVLGDVANMFPDNYIHIGGDEARSACWGGCTTQDVQHLWLAFYSKVMTNVLNLNKNMMVWEECISQYNTNPLKGKPVDTIVTFINANPTLKSKVLVSAWTNNPVPVLEQGFNIVDTSVFWYLDCGGGNWVTGQNSWCDPFKTWFDCYIHDPYEYWNPSGGTRWPPGDTIQIDPKYYNQIKGGECCIWGEEVDYTNYLNKTFPRASAIGERLWSPRNTAGGTPVITNGNIGPNATSGSTLNMALAGNSPIFSVIDRLRKHCNFLSRTGIRTDPMQIKYCDAFPAECDNYCFLPTSCKCTGGGNTSDDCSNLYCPQYDPNVKPGQPGKDANGLSDGTQCVCKGPFWGGKY